ncbi:NAD(P)H-binding protein [Plantibacter flavus]|uniref:NAD(P)H-binding protein n=1 Tax=Plantibacter flavus TaxID=150123 RepID=UPI003F18C1FE
MTTIRTVLIVGATGSIGRLVTEEAGRDGHITRALVRPTSNGEPHAPGAVAVVGDLTDPDQHALTFLQGDTRRAGDPSDGAISRRQLGQVLIESLTSASAEDVTFELVADTGPTPAQLEPLFAALDRDPADSIDGVRDPDNLPARGEPDRVRADLTKHTSMKGN